MEVKAVHLFDPWMSMQSDPVTQKLFLVVIFIAFFALLMAAIWRQAKKFPIRAINDSSLNDSRKF